MLAGSALPLPCKAKAFHFVCSSYSPGRHCAGPHLRSRRIESLHTLARWSHWACQCLSLCNNFTRNLCSPVSQIIGNLKLYRYIFNSPHFSYKLCKDCRKSAGFATPDHLKCFPLLFVGSLINEYSHSCLGFATPNIDFETSQCKKIKICK